MNLMFGFASAHCGALEDENRCQHRWQSTTAAVFVDLSFNLAGWLFDIDPKERAAYAVAPRGGAEGARRSKVLGGLRLLTHDGIIGSVPQCIHSEGPMISRRVTLSPAHELAARRLALLALAVLLAGGCASAQYVSLRKTPKNPLAEQLQLFSRSGPKPSPRVMQVLRRYGLADELNVDNQALLRRLEAFHEQEPMAESRYALAELSYISGVKAKATNKKKALDYFGSAVAHSYQYLFDHRLAWQRNVYDPEFRGACNLYNSALEETLRLVAGGDGLCPGSVHHVQVGNRRYDVAIVNQGQGWKADEFKRFEFVSDYEVRGLTNQYHNYGLGVPLIGVRRSPGGPLASERFYPPDLSLPVTAFLRVLPAQPGDGGSTRAQLELYDSLTVHDIDIGGIRVPLESDLSTPLAYFLNKPSLESLGTLGLIRPDSYENLRGLYMVQPYEPGKIPVLMVHGLWSSPITWMEMFNDLRSDPVIRKHYQFWFYLYPTGQPFWVSAAQLRRDLAEAREVLDPARQQWAMDQTVLVGHSMGGLVSVMQTIESGDAYWRTVSDQPIELIKAETSVKNELESTFFFRPSSSIRRVITIGTPHRGSKFANDVTRFLGRKIIAMPRMLIREGQQLYRDNPGAFKNDSLLKVPTSIDSLSPDCPILPVLLSAPRPAWVKYHNIVGVVKDENILNRVSGTGDGVVNYESAHLDNVESEIVVNADHLHVHRHPISVLEVRRILLAHLREAWQLPDPRWPRVYTASAESSGAAAWQPPRLGRPPWMGPELSPAQGSAFGGN
jgi:pimeloyl-ACP methyl ester carboxylesterase